MTTAITVRNLSKQYRIGQMHRLVTFREALVDLVKRPFRRQDRARGTIWALKDVSFEVGDGEVVGIIGRNGAGKSTLLKLLSKITYPTSGSIKVRGRIASLLEVGTGFHSELTGRENIYLNGSIMGMRKKEIDTQLDAIIAFAGVEKFVDTPIKRYSSGMHLRLGFAVAAHLAPDILLVDEVLAVGDVEFQKKCLKAMDDLRSGGRTVIFVSHNMAAVENHCPRAIWIDNGLMREDGDAKEVIRSYLSTFAGAQQTGFDLRQIEYRRGSGEIRYTGIEFLGPDDQPQRLIRSGDSFTVRLHYYSEERIVSPHFGLEILTDLGTKITSMNTWSNGTDIPVVHPGPGHIDLHIDFLNLMPGRYYISLWLKTLGSSVYDVLDHCAMFDVETSDFYRSGRGLDSHFGIVFLPCRWIPRVTPGVKSTEEG